MCFSCALHASSKCLGLACASSRCFKRVESAVRSSGFITERLRCFRSFVWVSSAPTDTTPRCSATQRTSRILVLFRTICADCSFVCACTAPRGFIAKRPRFPTTLHPSARTFTCGTQTQSVAAFPFARATQAQRSGTVLVAHGAETQSVGAVPVTPGSRLARLLLILQKTCAFF